MPHLRGTHCGILAFSLVTMLSVAQTPEPSKPEEPKKPGEQAVPADVLKMLGMRPPEDPSAVARGNRDFVAKCAFCHGSSATGGEGGPDLVRSLVVLHDERGNKIGPVILQGRPQKGMPKFAMSEAQISDISAFLRSQAQKKGNRDSYQIQNVVTGDPKAGQAYFSAKCAGCHSPTGDLAHIAARFDPVKLQSRFLYPRSSGEQERSGPPPPEPKVTVRLSGGATFTGTLKHLDDFSVSLYDSAGEYHSWLREHNPGMTVEVQDPLAAHAALLPHYSDTDMHNILAYLETLK